MVLISINSHPNMDTNKFKEIRSSLSFPKTGIINDTESILLKGWIFSMSEENISIILKQGEKYQTFSLNTERIDVKNKFFQRENINIPLVTGFFYHLEYKSDFEIYLQIADKLFAWKQVKYKVVEENFLKNMKNILVDSNSLNQEKKIELQLLSKKLKNKMIDTIFTPITIFDSKNIKNIKKMSQEKKSYLKNFIQKIDTPNILEKFFESIDTTGTIQLQSPFSNSISFLVLNISFKNVNYLKFHSQDGDFYIIQFLHTIDAIYFPKYDLLFRADHSHLDMQHIKSLLQYLFFETDLTKDTHLHKKNLIYKGIVLNGISPYHFYYDVLPVFEYMNANGDFIHKIKHLFSLNAKSYFSINSLYDLDIVETPITSEDLQSIIEKDNEFVLQVGTSYKNISNLMIQSLDERLLAKSLKKYTYDSKIEKNKIKASGLVLWIGISSQKRAWINQNDLIIKLLDELSLKYKNITVIFDGMTKSIFPMYDTEKAVSDDMFIVDKISLSLKKNIFPINLINKTSSEKLYYAALSDFFIANYSTGSIYPSRMLKKHGVTHLSNTMFDIVKDIHIHHNIEHFPKEATLDIPNTKESRVDFVSYQLEEEVFLRQTLTSIANYMTSFKGNNTSPYVFVHIPKTAGTSFRIAIERKIKLDKVLYDYGKSSRTTSPLIVETIYSDKALELLKHLNEIKFIMGHFNVTKYYTILQKPKIITFIRDPLQRVISEYKHKQRLDGYSEPFETFYTQENQQNKQYKFLGGVKLEDIFFIGLTEEYDKSILLFNKKTNLKIHVLGLNKSEKSLQAKYDIPDKTRKVLEELNSKDMDLYIKAKKIFYQELEKITF